MNIWILYGKCGLAERSTSPWLGSEVSKTQAILSSFCFLVASCGSRSEPSATVPATTSSLCHHDSDPLEPQSQMSSLAMVFHHGSRKGTNTVGLSRRSQHVCVLVPKCRCVLRSFPFLLPACPGSTHYMSSRLLPSVSGSPSFLAELWEDLPDASLWLE